MPPKFIESEMTAQFGHSTKAIGINVANIVIFQPDEYIDHLGRRAPCTLIKFVDGRTIQIVMPYADMIAAVQ